MIKRQKSIKLNFILNAFLTVSNILFPLITFPYISRILLPEGTGKVAFATSLISYFTLFSQLGIPTYGIRACAKVRDNKEELSRTAQELLIINLVMSTLVYSVFFLMLAGSPQLRKEKTLYIIMSVAILLNSLGMEWLYKALEQYAYITARSVIFKLLALVAMFVLIRGRDDYVLYGGLSIFAASASNILNFIHAHRYITMKPLGGYHFGRHLKAVAIFFAMSCATTIYTHIDATMLGIMVSDAEVGFYDAAVKIRTALLSVVTSLGAVLLPRSSYYIERGETDAFKRVTQKAMQFVFLLASSLSLFFILFARQSILLLSGEKYLDSVLPMQIIMPTVLLVGITNILGIQMLVPLGKEKYVLYSEIAGAVTDLILNILLIPSMGAAGAAVGTLVAEGAVLTVQFFSLRKEATQALRQVKYKKIAIALLAAGAASYWIGFLKLSNFITLFLSAIFFFGTYGIIMLISKEPIVTEIWKQFISFVNKKILKKADNN